jgi:protein tyrosine/serine phosphatase
VTKTRVLVVVFAAAIVVAVILLGNTFFSSRLGRSSPPPVQHTASLDDGIAAIRLSLPLFYRVDQQYTRGSEPAHGGVEMLTKLGVRTVVDLRSTYDRTEEIQIATERAGLTYHWLPLSVWEPPNDTQVSEFMSLVGDVSKGPFFVFCTDGLHRTGEMTAIYRIVHDNWDIRRALAEMDEIGFNPYYYSMRNYVWSYARRFRRGSVTKEASRPRANPDSSSERRPPGVGG